MVGIVKVAFRGDIFVPAAVLRGEPLAETPAGAFVRWRDEPTAEGYAQDDDEPRVELRRVLDWCGLYATEETLDQVCGRIKPTLVHHHVSAPELAAAGASPELLALYSTLCVKASTPPSAARSVPENFASV